MIPELFWIFELDLAALEQNRLDCRYIWSVHRCFGGYGVGVAIATYSRVFVKEVF